MGVCETRLRPAVLNAYTTIVLFFVLDFEILANLKVEIVSLIVFATL